MHEMYENDSAMYAGSSAWHGLGTVVADALAPMTHSDLLGWIGKSFVAQH